MFYIVSELILREDVESRFQDKRAGGLVFFEGRVRNINDGKAVNALEYEIYHELCQTEADAIIKEAKSLFNVREIFGWHREGRLSLGDVAVWIGVSAQHRGDAFKACRYIIDEIKHRLPIWKKEHYADGITEWINCQGCAVHHPFSESDFYHRQMRLPEVGESGQARLGSSKVLVVGAGGLGVPVLTSLVAAGVGKITIMDDDIVDASNLHRQTLYRIDQIGASKVMIAKHTLGALNPFISMDARIERIDSSNAMSLVKAHDVIVDCTDNFATKFLLQDVCHLSVKPLFHASIHRFDANIHVYIPQKSTPCLRCVWPEEPEEHCVATCADAGVLGAAVGTIGHMQALEVIRYLMNPDAYEWQGLRMIDLWSRRDEIVRIAKDPNCPLCSAGATIKSLKAKDEFDTSLEIKAAQITRGKHLVIDIRESTERDGRYPLEATIQHLPMSAGNFERELDRNTAVVLVCQSGMRSLSLAKELRSKGMDQVYSLEGGISQLGRAVEAGHHGCRH